MVKSRIAVFSGPRSTVANSPPLVTGNKGRRPGEPMLPGRFDHLVAQTLYEPVKIKIQKFSAHPLEEDVRHLYLDDGRDYWEVELRPEDGPLPLPYVARRADGTPFEENDPANTERRQSAYPDASRIFEEIDRTIAGRDEHGAGNALDRLADYDFIRALPPAGYASRGEIAGRDYFFYGAVSRFPPASALARVANVVQATLNEGRHAGAIWLEGSSHIEETLYWLSLMIDTDLPIVGVAAQRPHGQLSGDGDRNIADAVRYIVSGQGAGLGAVAAIDEQIFAARDLKKGDDRPGGFKVTGGHGGILGTMGPPVTIWYAPRYRHTRTSRVNLTQLPTRLALQDASDRTRSWDFAVKNADGTLRGDSIPRVHIVKYAHYSSEGSGDDPEHEVDIMARIGRARAQEADPDPGVPKLHGFVLEGAAAYGYGSNSQMAALAIAAFSGLPVVRVGRGDPGGRIATDPNDPFIEGSNLDANKARMLLIAAMLRLGRLPAARDPRHPSEAERKETLAKIAQFQEIFETH
jgi:L-asparaginase/Glu-tRNA(Gln) amidotransferase subunit D